MVHMESFPYRLADNKWHKIALSISGTEIQLLVDCNPLYKRVTHFVPDRNFSASNMQLLVGQRNLNSHSLFKVCVKCFSCSIKLLSIPYFNRASYKKFTFCLDHMDIYFNVSIWTPSVRHADNFCSYKISSFNYVKIYFN